MTKIITGDAFGVDRIDYLLRDSHHAGVAYGKFDHYRLIDTLRILPHPKSEQPMIGIQKGGIHAAEALQLARQFMFLQLYYHDVRIAYDIHLREFLRDWLKTYPTDVEGHLKLTDNEILREIAKAAENPSSEGHEPATRIARRKHFKTVYERNAKDQRLNPDAVEKVAAALREKFGANSVRHHSEPPKSQKLEFPVLTDYGEISSSIVESNLYADFKPAAIGFVFVDPDKREAASQWLKDNRKKILAEQMELDL